MRSSGARLNVEVVLNSRLASSKADNYFRFSLKLLPISTFDDVGIIGDVTGVYGGLQQPTGSIPSEITRHTEIADEMVAGQVIDTQQLRALIEPADLVIAHNAGFDRPLCEAFSPLLRESRGLFGLGN